MPHILIEYSIRGYCEMPQFLIATRQLCPSDALDMWLALPMCVCVSCERKLTIRLMNFISIRAMHSH